MSQQIIDVGAAANDGTGESLRNAFTAVNSNFTEIYTAGPVGSNIAISGNVITNTALNGNIVLKPNGIGVIQANAAVLPSIDNVYDLGSAALRFDTVYAGYYYGNGAFLTGISGGSGNGQAIVAALETAKQGLNANIPFAVCPYCKGTLSDSCRFCKGRGIVGDFAYKHVPGELKS